ncbi:MAG: hypothetical protein MJ178_06575 [Treponemataceae bacterium]|nr:hypothetical protein [Treponemataceae bacterium]
MKKVLYTALLMLAVLLALAGCRAVSAKTQEYDFYGSVHELWLQENSELVEALEYVDSTTLCRENIISSFITYFDTAEPADELEAMLFAAYRSALDFESRNAADYSELHAILEKIESAATIEELVDVDSDIYRDIGASTLISFYGDMVSAAGCYHISLFEPIPGGADIESVVNYYQNLLAGFGIPRNRKAYQSAIVLLDNAQSLKLQKQRLPEDSLYFTQLVKQCAPLNLEKICRDRSIMQTGLMTKEPNVNISSLVSFLCESDVDQVRVYMEMSLLGRLAPFLSEEIARNFFAYTGERNHLYQTDFVSCTKRHMVEYMMNSWYPLMELIFDRYIVTPEKLQEIQVIAADILATYVQAVEETTLFNDIIQPKVLRLLKRVETNIGLPVRDVSYYAGCSLEQYGLLQCVAAINRATGQYVYDSRIRERDPLRGKVTSYTVNSWADSFSITVLGGDLVYPYYTADMSISRKYGAIGARLAHEYSHVWGAGTTNNPPINGYDRMIQVYDGYEEYSGVTCSGKQVSTEAAADIFGLQVALRALEQQVAEPDYREFFLGFATREQAAHSKGYDDYLMNVIKDPHPLPRCRVNCAVMHSDQFYSAFDIKPGNAMYLPESERFRL